MTTFHTQISSLSPSYNDFREGFVEADSVEAIHLALAEVGYDAEVVNVEGRKGEYLIRVATVTSLPSLR